MRNLTISIVLLSLVLTGCGTLDKKVMLINTGDSKERVLDAMGAPQDRQVQDQQEAWQYCKSGAGFGWNDHKVIWFKAGLVTGINTYRTSVSGCTGGIQPIHWENAPNTIVEIRQR